MQPRPIYCGQCENSEDFGYCCGRCKKCLDVLRTFDDCVGCHEKLVEGFWVSIGSCEEDYMEDRACYTCYYKHWSMRHGKEEYRRTASSHIAYYYEDIEESGVASVKCYLRGDWDNVHRKEKDGKPLQVPDNWKHWIPISFGRYKNPLVNTDWKKWLEPPQNVLTQAKQ